MASPTPGEILKIFFRPARRKTGGATEAIEGQVPVTVTGLFRVCAAKEMVFEKKDSTESAHFDDL